jgi:hypothetical protein
MRLHQTLFAQANCTHVADMAKSMNNSIEQMLLRESI